MNSIERKTWAPLGALFCVLVSGCGTPGAPQPPSLNLPDPIADLSASRAGDQVTLNWTNPKRNTDRTAVKLDVETRICRREANGPCNLVNSQSVIAPGNPTTYVDTLPHELASGTPRPISYFVELRNRKGRSAGLSNAATVLAGEAPHTIEGVKAEVRKQGVVLSWSSGDETGAIRLERKLLTPPPPKSQQGPLSPAPEPLSQNFLVETGTNQARTIDKTVRFGESYEYRAQRLARVGVDGKMLELAGAFSSPIDVDVKDVFPPAVPAGLAAVATAAENGASPSIDLSWQPDADPDLAGYIVYRREDNGNWLRISPSSPIVEPAFHDAQVQAGRTYWYAVSAIDKGGFESSKSTEAQETVPQQ